MASLLTHPVVPLTMAVALGPRVAGSRLAALGVAATLVADLDVIAFAAGIPYHSPFGHRGFTHSVVFALFVAACASVLAPRLDRPVPVVGAFVFISALSHPVLDAMTNGGLGVAILWPVDESRWFAPWRPLEVSPIGVQPFLSDRGLRVLRSELIRIWFPCALLAGGGVLARRALVRPLTPR